MIRTRREPGLESADHTFGAQRGELGVGEPELLVQHLVGVLADLRAEGVIG